jgi:hypothetical protein
MAVALLLIYKVPSASAQRKKEVRTRFPTSGTFSNVWGLKRSVHSSPPLSVPLVSLIPPFFIVVGFAKEGNVTFGDVESESRVE